MKYLDQVPTITSVGELVDVYRQLLQAVSRSAIRLDSVRCDKFQCEIDSLFALLGEDATLLDLQMIADSAEKSIEEYNRSVCESFEARYRELHQVLGALTAAVEELAGGNLRIVTNLRAIEKQIDLASRLNDIGLVRQQLTECMSHLRREITRHQEASNRIIAEARGNKDGALQKSAENEKFEGDDPITAFPGRASARRALQTAIATQADFCVAVFVIPRIESVSQRWGQAVSNRLLKSLSADLRKDLTMVKQFWRWNSSAVVALAEGTPAPRMRSEIRRFATSHPDEIVDTGQRTVLLPLDMSGVVFEGSTISSTEELWEKIEKACKGNMAQAA